MFQRRNRTRDKVTKVIIRNDAMQESGRPNATRIPATAFDCKSKINSDTSRQRKRKHRNKSPVNVNSDIRALIVLGFGLAFLIFFVYMRVAKKSLTLLVNRDNNSGRLFRPVYPALPDGRIDPNRKNEDLSFKNDYNPLDFKIMYDGKPRMKWEEDYDKDFSDGSVTGPSVDYTFLETSWPQLRTSVPEDYPQLEPLANILERWPQDQLDNPPVPFRERLMHFDYNDTVQMEIALLFRKSELPFKVYNVPEIIEAGKKWDDDEYVQAGFNESIRRRMKMRGEMAGNKAKHKAERVKDDNRKKKNNPKKKYPGSFGHAQESNNNFFAFFIAERWKVKGMGQPPTMDIDWPYITWAKHARYADQVSLSADKAHFYFQAGVDQSERFIEREKQSFISRDLPSFGGAQESFFMFNAHESSGVQCRFGERGVTAAFHYDTGRNMVGMILGAKRYILSPPIECPKMGIEKNKKHPLFRHSVLNFGRFGTTNMPEIEKEWLKIAGGAMSVETILKKGEVLYIPSNWFHYITSLMKSAQCNTRSGDDLVGTERFGNQHTVFECAGGSFDEMN
mmetsp:Transcript_5315/g.7861  ORF Transcript_5315/g.7861 Transcript_5315/m.7861 type:complete len:564 (-) Transcript_5315:4988-6679(-)